MKLLGMEMKHLKGTWVASLMVHGGLLILAAGFYQLFYKGIFASRPFGFGVGLICVGALSWYYYHDDLKSGPRIEPRDETLPDADAYESLLEAEGFVDADFDEDKK